MTRHRLPTLLALPILALAFACTEEEQITTVELPLMVSNAPVGHTGTTGKSYTTGLSQEVNTSFTGDPDGVGTALLTLNAGRRIICWSTTASNLQSPAFASHIHQAPFGISGPIVQPLTHPDETGTASGCAEDVARSLIVDILRNPAAYYVNVHTDAHPAGAIRGQLGR